MELLSTLWFNLVVIAEKINIDFDLSRLVAETLQIKATFPIICQSQFFGGWSITSSDGDYTDGWQKGHLVYSKFANASPEETRKEFERIGIKSLDAYSIKTNACTPGFSDLVDVLEVKNFFPRRCRIIELKAGGASLWHRDGEDGRYAVRLHIPLISNPGCIFKTETEVLHMPADGGCYLIHVNRLHQVVNTGNTDRYHFVCNVTDASGFSEFHRLHPKS